MGPACGQCEQRCFPADGLIKLGGGGEHAVPFCPVSQLSAAIASPGTPKDT